MDSLITEKQNDGFSKESPIRAFTDWREDGCYAVGKGFRPALAHLTTYLSAMFEKEGWRLVQIIEATNPTMVFERARSSVTATLNEIDADNFQAAFGLPTRPVAPVKITRDYDPPDAIAGDPDKTYVATAEEQFKFYQSSEKAAVEPDLGAPHDADVLVTDQYGIRTAARYVNGVWVYASHPTVELEHSPLEWEPYPTDDPVNHRHYAGTACAEIGELLTANSYQVLKYVWRLGEKDDPIIELGKAIWYCKREIAMIGQPHRSMVPLVKDFLIKRLEGKSPLTRSVAMNLWNWTFSDAEESVLWVLNALENELESRRAA